MYDKKIYRDVTGSWPTPPSSVTNCHTFSDPPSPSSVMYFMDFKDYFKEIGSEKVATSNRNADYLNH